MILWDTHKLQAPPTVINSSTSTLRTTRPAKCWRMPLTDWWRERWRWSTNLTNEQGLEKGNLDGIGNMSPGVIDRYHGPSSLGFSNSLAWLYCALATGGVLCIAAFLEKSFVTATAPKSPMSSAKSLHCWLQGKRLQSEASSDCLDVHNGNAYTVGCHDGGAWAITGIVRLTKWLSWSLMEGGFAGEQEAM